MKRIKQEPVADQWQTAFRSNNGKLLPEFFTMVQYYVENFNETLKF